MLGSRELAQPVHGHDRFGSLLPGVDQQGGGALALGIAVQPFHQSDQAQPQITQADPDRCGGPIHMGGKRRQPRRRALILSGIQQHQPLNAFAKQAAGQFRGLQTQPG